MAWRNGGKTEDQKNEEEEKKKTVRFGDDVEGKNKEEASKLTKMSAAASTGEGGENKINFLYDQGGTNFNFGAIPTFEETGTTANADKKYESKESCWFCFRLYPMSETVKDPLN